MNRKTYLRRLRSELQGVPKGEVENLVSYYFELIDEGVERGKTEQEVCAELEPPELVAENYKRENGFESAPRSKRGGGARASSERWEDAPVTAKKRRVPVWLVVVGLPVWLPLLIVAFVCAFVLVIVLFALFIVISALSLALIVGGLYVIAMSFGLFGGHAALAFAQIGFGLAAVALGFLLSLLIPLLWKALASGIRRMVHAAAPSEKPRRSRKGAVALFACSAAVLFAGVIIAASAYAGLGFNYRRLAVWDDFTEHTELISLQSDSLTLNTDQLALTVERTEGDARIVFWDTEESSRAFTYEEGVITLTSPDQSGGAYLKAVWERGVLYPTLAGLKNEATLYLPLDYTGSLTVENENGSVSLDGFTLQSVSVTTENGAVKVSDCTFGSLAVRTKNGAVSLRDVTVSETLEAEAQNGALKVQSATADTMAFTTHNGAISLKAVKAGILRAQTNNGAVTTDRVGADVIELTCSNGAISGYISGSASEYKITAETVNGSCNLKNTLTGEKTLSVRTGNGAIRLFFNEE